MEGGEYDLEWDFTGGTGRFEGAEGTGHTDGLVDLSTAFAQYRFSGTITVPKKAKKPVAQPVESATWGTIKEQIE